MSDTEREAMCNRIDELCQENERLRKAKDTMRGDAFEIGAMLVKVRDENAKLRTFVDGLMFCHASSAYDDCIGCPLLDQSTHNYRCTKTECMQDLGFETAE